MLAAKSISKQYGQTKALDQAELSMKPGEIHALLGSNGSGKSTIAKVLGGLVGKNEGEITIDGKEIQLRSAKDSLAQGIALAYQDYSLVDQLTVEENLFLNSSGTLKMGFIDYKKRFDQTFQILKQFHISAQPDTYVGSLNESDKSLLEVAKALVYKPRYLILDEVTACLHRDQVLVLFDILRKEKKEGLSILFISHRFDEVYELCETVTIFRNGKTVITTDLTKVTNDDIVYYMTGQKETIKKQHNEKQAAEKKEPLLSIQHLGVGTQVNDVSLNLYPGEILGVCGLQGQGQSEFLRAVYGSRKISRGNIIYKGKRLTKFSPERSLKSGMAFISGDRNSEGIFADRSIFENINISRSALRFIFHGIRLNKSMSEANQLIKKLDVVIGEIGDPASSLSGGNQQKLIFARDLLLNPSVVLLDDPAKGVDVKARSEIQGILRGLSDKGMACIYYSSDYKELTAVSDRIVVFYEGDIIAEFNDISEEIESDLAAAMLGATRTEAE
ncbi:sugar ABC transporter ATP-binding protein [Caproiciproducens galactitolivorans]|uniref:Sugar ABC transporter ATP-binding protein n=1 Tax=Caproiciproducens galactitolivorans TaxID=642589 RepID=A0ABT4BQF2_9FIRM|nr:sugar ABC transporter ATP-binding protein [Caproiciproducens galactitolivorans]MCY1713122.1 sugar ABC transporter ATP-binding protein [Caproiciproducens galactitolivorans]